MTDTTENLVLEHLRGLRNQIESFQTETRADLREIKHRLNSVETGILGLRRDGVGTQDDIYRQQAAIDRLSERIERRLELAP